MNGCKYLTHFVFCLVNGWAHSSCLHSYQAFFQRRPPAIPFIQCMYVSSFVWLRLVFLVLVTYLISYLIISYQKWLMIHVFILIEMKNATIVRKCNKKLNEQWIIGYHFLLVSLACSRASFFPSLFYSFIFSSIFILCFRKRGRERDWQTDRRRVLWYELLYFSSYHIASRRVNHKSNY